jgi:hypothetical protein
MNTFSFFLIFLFGLLFSFIFSDLLRELGLKKEYTKSIAVVFILPFISLIVFLIHPIFVKGSLAFSDISLFYSISDGLFMWMTIALGIGAAARFALYSLRPGMLE